MKVTTKDKKLIDHCYGTEGAGVVLNTIASTTLKGGSA
jgi:hypothetical protein